MDGDLIILRLSNYFIFTAKSLIKAFLNIYLQGLYNLTHLSYTCLCFNFIDSYT